jgi:hypothetical protein
MSSISRAHGSPNDRILYVGMNEDSATVERGALASRGASVDEVTSEAASAVSFDGVAYDLADPAGATHFAAAVGAAYGLEPKQVAALGAALVRAPWNGRDELARIALEWAPAEAGAAIPSRLVLSGHSSSGLLWGRSSVIDYVSICELARALPKAAEQIEDVHISGCFTEAEVQEVARWTLAFPNLLTLWAYREYAPAAATAHLLDWEIATRGRTAKLSEHLVASHPPVTAWSSLGGVVGSGMSLGDRRSQRADADLRFEAYFTGDRRIAHAHQPDAERDYGAYQLLAAHRDATPAEHAASAARAAVMLRLRFYEQSIRGELANKHGAAIDAALSRVGLPPADFATLSRKDALAVIDAYDARVRDPSDPVSRLFWGVRELRSDVIPEGWCH